jgi:hypothetical protein
MKRRFQHAALVGKYNALGSRHVIDAVARFLIRQGLEVSLDQETALNTGITDHGAFTIAELGQRCDLAVVIGGDGTMLGVARQMARFDIPLVGINQGRLGFITDVPIDEFTEALGPWSPDFKVPDGLGLGFDDLGLHFRYAGDHFLFKRDGGGAADFRLGLGHVLVRLGLRFLELRADVLADSGAMRCHEV